MPLTPPPSSASSPPKRARRKEARPGELLEAALDLFTEKGYAGTRVEEVAARAGVSKGTLFLYFASKEDLFKAVVRENIVGQFSDWNQELEAFQGSTDDALRAVYQLWWERVGDTKLGSIAKLMIGEAPHFPEIARFYHQEVTLPSHALIRRLLQRGIERGEFKAVDLDYAIYVIVSPMLFALMWKYSMVLYPSEASTLSPSKYLAMQIENILYGLSANAPKASPTGLPHPTPDRPRCSK